MDTVTEEQPVQQPKSRSTIGISFAIVTVLTLLALLSFLFISIFSGDGEGGDPNREGGNVIFAIIWMAIAAAILAFIGWRVLGNVGTKSTRYGVGAFGGCIVLYANLAFVAFIYFVTFKVWGDEGFEEGERISFIMSIVCLVLAIIYAILGAVVLRSNQTILADDNRDSSAEADASASGAYTSILSDSWKIVSGVSVILLLISLVMIILPLFGEEAGRAMEEGNFWTSLAIILWSLLIVSVLLKVGKGVFGGPQSTSQFQIGTFNGALLFFALLNLLLAGLYGSFRIREPADAAGGSIAFSFVCIFLALLHGTFAMALYKYRHSIIQSNATDPPSIFGGWFAPMS